MAKTQTKKFLEDGTKETVIIMSVKAKGETLADAKKALRIAVAKYVNTCGKAYNLFWAEHGLSAVVIHGIND
jgi:hypothetical protein